eukprot:GILI01020653.1.p1 GENE.GILI01020653.1~~GILI01020653.1.p1  ORF type:complete len:411 (+),score=142.36 GILI01020653.1:67-1233(+)
MKQECQCLHGDIPQAQREVTLQGFREGKFRCLIATDVAARGLDIPEVDLVVQCQIPKDFETYIHRSGRTGRAGRDGTCILFFAKRDAPMVTQLELRTGIKFTRIGAPQPVDIVRASARDAQRSLDVVSDKVLPMFKEVAEELIESRGAVNALAAALAFMTGNTTAIKSRSLLSSFEGFTTYLFKVDHTEIRSMSYVWSTLKGLIGEQNVAPIRGMKKFRDCTGVAFDVPDSCLEAFQNLEISNPHIKVELATELPELEEDGPGPMEPRGRGMDSRGRGMDRGRSMDASRRDRASSAPPRGGFGGGGLDDRRVFVGGLSYSTDEDSIKGLFENCGSVEAVRILQDPATGQSKGVAFVTFADAATASKACKLSGTKLEGRTVRINMANSK